MWATALALCAWLGTITGSSAGTPPSGAEHSLARPAAYDSLPTRQVLRRALRSDASQEYLLYIPSHGGRGAPLFVTAHGISRNLDEHAALFAPHAERYGVVLVAPFFSAEGHDDYQRLGRVGRGRRADLALDAILEDVRALTGAADGKFHLFGFSGGAQFAHRYVLAHPERIAGAVVAAPGWYTFPDPETAYPYGLGETPELPDLRFDPDRFLRVPITVMVGGADTASANLRRNAQVDRQQGRTRRERAERWTAAMRRAAESRGLPPLVACIQVPGIGHSFREFMNEGGLGERVFAALFDAKRQAAVPVGAR